MLILRQLFLGRYGSFCADFVQFAVLYICAAYLLFVQFDYKISKHIFCIIQGRCFLIKKIKSNFFITLD